jgi:hypothetical protein
MVIVAERKRAMKLRETRGKELSNLRRRVKFPQVHILRTDGVCDDLVESRFVADLVVHEHLAEAFASAGDFLEHIIHNSAIHEASIYKKVQGLFYVHRK